MVLNSQQLNCVKYMEFLHNELKVLLEDATLTSRASMISQLDKALSHWVVGYSNE